MIALLLSAEDDEISTKEIEDKVDRPWADVSGNLKKHKDYEKALVSVREQIEFLESVVIQEWWPDSRRVTDVDGEEPRTLRPQHVAIPK